MPALPMFPLGTVLLPGATLPLQVFEPRYQVLVLDCLRGDREFGVVLIERGSEVGGGDVRFDVGCVARIVQADSLVGGRWRLLAVGDRRIRVEQWLDDDPYPRAEVVDWPDAPPDIGDADALRAARDEVAARLRRVLAMAVELGEPAPPAGFELPDDLVAASHQLAGLSPVGPLDRLALLAAPTVAHRLSVLGEALVDTERLLATRLAGG